MAGIFPVKNGGWPQSGAFENAISGLKREEAEERKEEEKGSELDEMVPKTWLTRQIFPDPVRQGYPGSKSSITRTFSTAPRPLEKTQFKVNYPLKRQNDKTLNLLLPLCKNSVKPVPIQYCNCIWILGEARWSSKFGSVASFQFTPEIDFASVVCNCCLSFPLGWRSLTLADPTSFLLALSIHKLWISV